MSADHPVWGLAALLALTTTSASAASQEPQVPSGETGWTEPVNGIRACAFAVQDNVPIGEPVHLVVLFQNVSDERVTLPGVDLASAVVVEGKDEPLDENFESSHSAMIVQSIPGVDLSDWNEPHGIGLQQAMLLTSLSPGGMHVVSIELRSPAEAVRLFMERQSRERLVVQRLHAYLLQPDEPGSRDLEFMFRPSGFAEDDGLHREIDAKWRDVEFHLPPVRVKLYDPQQPMQEVQE